jgi:hypothetical protein
MARISKLYDTRGRLSRVLSAVRREPTGAQPTTNVRIKLGALPAALRAVVRHESHGGILIEAELPWLTVGSDIQAEFPDGREKAGRVHWFGVDATSAGSARLRIFVDLSAADGTSPAKLPDIDELTPPPPTRWFWPLATALLLVVSSVLGYALWRRPVQPAMLPSAAPTDATAPRPATPTIAVPKQPPETPPVEAAPPAAAAPIKAAPVKAAPANPPPARPKAKHKRR